MATKFQKLTPAAIRKLQHGSISEHGITFRRAAGGDGTYSFNVMVDGTRIHRVVGRESEGVTRSVVERAIEHRRAQAREQRLSLPKGRKTPMRFEEAATNYLDRLAVEGGKDLNAKRRRIEQHLMPFFGKMPLPNIGIADIERYKGLRRQETAIRGGERVKPKDQSKLAKTRPGTVNRELAALSHLLHKAVEWGWISHVPAKVALLKDEARRIDYLTVEECQRLLEAAKADDNPQTLAFIMIGLHSAMRRTEILSIRREDVDLAARVIYVPKAKAGARKQPITSQLAEFLKDHLAAMPSDTPWLFPSATSTSGHTTDVRKAFRRAVIAAGLDPDRVLRHTLRHTAITHMVQALVNLPTVAVFSGHKTLAMVQRYAHANTAHVHTSLDKLEARLKKVG